MNSSMRVRRQKGYSPKPGEPNPPGEKLLDWTDAKVDLHTMENLAGGRPHCQIDIGGGELSAGIVPALNRSRPLKGERCHSSKVP
jgi:hypothetical protein